MEIEHEAQDESAEMGDPNWGSFSPSIPFDTRVFEEEMYQVYLDPTHNPNMYSPCFEPLRLWFSRLLAIGSLTDAEINDLEMDLRATVTQCERLATNQLDHAILDTMEQHLKWKIRSHARRGFLLKTLTTYRKVLEMRRGEEKKKKRLFG